MESGQVPPPPPGPPTPPPTTPDATDDPLADAQKKFKIAAIAAAILGIAAIGFAIWAFSLNSDKNKDDKALAGDNALNEANQQRLASAKANYEEIRNSLASRDKEDAELETDIAQLKKELDTAQTEEENATSAEDKADAHVNTLEKQLALAQACAQGAIRSFGTLTSEANDDAGLSAIEGTISKLTTVNNECEEVVN